MDKLKMHSVNKVDENIEKIGSLFPNVLTEVIKGYKEDGSAIIERAIDFDVLCQELSSFVVEGLEERYQFIWPDKKKSILLACFDSHVTSEVITEIAKKQPYYAVFRDSSIASDSVATNFEQIFATYSPTTVRKVL